MEYKIIGNTVPAVEMKLKKDEVVYTQSGGMCYQSDGLEMKSNAKGGFMGSIGRMFAGESLFMADYKALADDVTIAFASTVPGSIMAVDLDELPEGWNMQKGAFLCAENSVEVKAVFTKKFGAGLFGGEGFVIQHATGKGKLFMEIDGDMIEKTLAPGEVLKVDTGNVVAFEPSVTYDVEMVKGLGNIFLGGEGLFLTKLVGPGKVVLQTENIKDFAGRIIPYIPTKSN